MLMGVAAGSWGVLIVLPLMGASFGNGWSDHTAQWRLFIYLFVYALVCLSSVAGIILAGLLHLPELTLIMSLSQAVPALIYYFELLVGPGEIRLGFQLGRKIWFPPIRVALLSVWVTPVMFGCIWVFTRNGG